MDRKIFSNFMNNMEKLTQNQELELKEFFEPDSDEFALLMLEKPWDTPKKNPKRASMLPFMQGLEKRRNNFNIYYSTFVDDKDFEKILNDDLCKTNEKRQIVYICAHGNSDTIGDGSADKILKSIANLKRNRRRPVEGIIVGSCLVGGGAAFELEVAVEERGVNWIFGYNVSIGWMASVFIEMAIIEELSYIPNTGYLNDFEAIFNVFIKALGRFDPNWKVGFKSSVKSSPNVSLKDAVVLHVRKKNDTYSLGNVSSMLFERIKVLQTP